MNSEKYIGLDFHQATIVVAVMDSTGKLVMEFIVETKTATIFEFFWGLRGHLVGDLRRRNLVNFLSIAMGSPNFLLPMAVYTVLFTPSA